MYIFLDDERMPSDVSWVALPKVDWTIVRDFKEFAGLVSSLTAPPILISFDHDLGHGHGIPDHVALTGKDCANFLIDICISRKWPLPAFQVHSMNPAGKANIESLLHSYKNFSSK